MFAANPVTGSLVNRLRFFWKLANHSEEKWFLLLKFKSLIKSPALLLTGVAGAVFIVGLGLFSILNSAPKTTPAQQALISSQPEASQVTTVDPTALPKDEPEPTLVVVPPVLTVMGDALGVVSIQQKKLQDQLNAATAKTFNLAYKDENWKITPDRLKKFVRLENGGLEIDRKAMGDQVKSWAKPMEKAPVNARVAWSEKLNKLTAIKPGVAGMKLNLDGTLDGIKAALLKGETRTDFVFEPDLPQVDENNLEKLGIKEIISEGTSGFAGSDANRAQNIVKGSDYLDNTLVPPHATFSFNNAIGAITKERGYADGYAIVGDATEKEVGGGICQVSTTTFRAAFWAGFNIVERNAHLYRVTWYESLGEPPGFDATIYQPGADFKFTNDTDNWLLVYTYVTGSKLRVVFYGTKPDWKVEMTPGSGEQVNVTNPPPPKYEVDPKLPVGAKKKVDSSHKGFDTFIGRTIKGLDGQIIRQTKFSTHYVAWPEAYKIGPSAPVATSPAATTPAAKTTAPAQAATTAAAKTTTPAQAATTEPGTTKPAAAPNNPPAPPETTKSPADNPKPVPSTSKP